MLNGNMLHCGEAHLEAITIDAAVTQLLNPSTAPNTSVKAQSGFE